MEYKPKIGDYVFVLTNRNISLKRGNVYKIINVDPYPDDYEFGDTEILYWLDNGEVVDSNIGINCWLQYSEFRKATHSEIMDNSICNYLETNETKNKLEILVWD